LEERTGYNEELRMDRLQFWVLGSKGDVYQVTFRRSGQNFMHFSREEVQIVAKRLRGFSSNRGDVLFEAIGGNALRGVCGRKTKKIIPLTLFERRVAA
jgi:hypothetical protein